MFVAEAKAARKSRAAIAELWRLGIDAERQYKDAMTAKALRAEEEARKKYRSLSRFIILHRRVRKVWGC